jgi:hypothetical protein
MQKSAQKISAGVDEGVSRRSSMSRPGSKDHHWHQRNFEKLLEIKPSAETFLGHFEWLQIKSFKLRELCMVCHLNYLLLHYI